MSSYILALLLMNQTGCLAGMQMVAPNDAMARCKHVREVKEIELKDFVFTSNNPQLYDEFEMGCRRALIKYIESDDALLAKCEQLRNKFEHQR